ncbi:Lipid A 3-O-deacylase (PagL) [Poriferisphaera corsica]|uniref:Lipid A 3-O-deacylase (PagL) n=1 Tax=Poriferisphaera corsica TaxID=2528020 RepID=A0A517YR53_9BACT|nr:acyloxyacyl hydrolase [Poriferisphaera corsica]QDU32708.1 Lipid A 3-O-deacylase (PagL) [Poriferisphaera corsica]
MSQLVHAFICFAVLLVSSGVHAQSFRLDDNQETKPFSMDYIRALAKPADNGDRSDDPFAEGSWTAQFYGSAIVGDPDHGFEYTGHFGFGYYFVDGLSINFEPLVGYVKNNFTPYEGTGVVGGFDLLFRWHFFGIDNNDTFSVYFDGGAGFQLADTDFPSDSHHDFRLLVGFGGTVKVPTTDNLRIMGGARYIHISNAGTSDVNDGLDGAQLYLGLMLNF